MRGCIELQSTSREINAAFVRVSFWRAHARSSVDVEKLDLIGFIAGSDRFSCLRLCSRSARRALVVTSGDGRLSWFYVRLGNLCIRLSSLVQFVVELVLGFLKLLYRLTHSAGELRQFFCAEENEDDQQDDDQVRPGQVHKAGEEAHFNWQHQTVSPSCKEFQRGRRAAGGGRVKVDRQSAMGKHSLLCVPSGKAASASGWFIFQWRFTSPRGRRSLVSGSFVPAISVRSNTKRWRKRTRRKFQLTRS